jgi:hypothetical protein
MFRAAGAAQAPPAAESAAVKVSLRALSIHDDSITLKNSRIPCRDDAHSRLTNWRRSWRCSCTTDCPRAPIHVRRHRPDRRCSVTWLTQLHIVTSASTLGFSKLVVRRDASGLEDCSQPLFPRRVHHFTCCAIEHTSQPMITAVTLAASTRHTSDDLLLQMINQCRKTNSFELINAHARSSMLRRRSGPAAR